MTAQTRSVWITGASSGIGAATAVAFGRAGHRVAIGARRMERLHEVAQQVEAAGGRAFVHALDVRDPESIEAFASAAEDALGPVDVLVNNAGQNLSALLHEATVEDLRADVEVNLLSALWMTRRVLPSMLARKAGDIVFIGSDTAVRPRTYMSAYAAAKAGLEALARVVEMETEGTGVRSILMRVGPTGSEFGNQMPKDRIKEILRSWKYWGLYRNMHWMPAESVAQGVLRTVSIPVDESYPAVVEVQPGGRKKEHEQ